MAITKTIGRFLIATTLKLTLAAWGNRVGAVAVVAIVLSVVNLGILMWQIWPEGSYTPPDRSFGYSAPSGDFRERISDLERKIGGLGLCVQGLSPDFDYPLIGC